MVIINIDGKIVNLLTKVNKGLCICHVELLFRRELTLREESLWNIISN